MKTCLPYVNLVQTAGQLGVIVPDYAKPKKKPQPKGAAKKNQGAARAKSRSVNLY